MSGLGNDIIEIERIRRLIDLYGKRFLDKVYTSAEQAYCDGHADSAPFYAARFAAKEAVSKAFGTGIGEDFSFHDLEVIKDVAGAPSIKNHPEVKLSLSHCREYALATALILN